MAAVRWTGFLGSSLGKLVTAVSWLSNFGAVVAAITSSPYRGDGTRAFAARMPETRGGGLRTSCGTWRVRCAVVSESKLSKKFDGASRRILLWAERADGASRKRHGRLCVARALAVWRLDSPPLSSESRYHPTRSVSVPALLLLALSPAAVISLSCRVESPRLPDTRLPPASPRHCPHTHTYPPADTAPTHYIICHHPPPSTIDVGSAVASPGLRISSTTYLIAHRASPPHTTLQSACCT